MPDVPPAPELPAVLPGGVLEGEGGVAPEPVLPPAVSEGGVVPEVGGVPEEGGVPEVVG